MIEDIARLLDNYWSWLRERTTLSPLDDWVEISTPFLDRHNDYLLIYAGSEGDGFVLSDDGHTIADLELSGCALNTPKRRELLNSTLNGFGVSNVGGVLEVRASVRDFALKKHNLIQAMLAVNDLFYLASSTVESIFLEDVGQWLDTNGVRYIPEVKFVGASGYDHRFDFVIPRSTEQPERVLRVINTPDRQSAQTLAFAWLDTSRARPSETRAYAILNDRERRIADSVVGALSEYGVSPIPWSQRGTSLAELVA